MRALVDALGALLLKDKAWVSTALEHLRKTLSGACAGGRLPEGSMHLPQEQMRHLYACDVSKSVGLELAPTIQQLAELFLCEHGEEVSGTRWPAGFTALEIILSVGGPCRGDANRVTAQRTDRLMWQES